MPVKRLQKIKTAHAYEEVCTRLRRAIHLGEYLPGNRLPSERELANQFGVSRVTVREAIRTLEGEGYIMSSGRAGGARLTVARLDERAKGFDAAVSGSQYMRQALRNQLQEIDDLFDFRQAIESAAARLAALRRTNDHLKIMRTSVRAMQMSKDIPKFRKADSQFHLAVADASANSYLQQAIEDARAEMFRPLDVLDDIDFSLTVSTDDHSKIITAIEARDPNLAEAMMTEHIESARKEIRRVIIDE